jgi:hypothetical protein
VDSILKIQGMMLVVLVCGGEARAQLGRGTFVAIALSQEKIVFAGDSRASVRYRIDDSQCKISAPEGKFIFYATGLTSFDGFNFKPRWSAWGEAKRASQSNYTNLQKAVNQWRAAMQLNIRILSDRQIRREPKIITTAGFAAREPNGNLMVMNVVIARVDTPKEG